MTVSGPVGDLEETVTFCNYFIMCNYLHTFMLENWTEPPIGTYSLFVCIVFMVCTFDVCTECMCVPVQGS